MGQRPPDLDVHGRPLTASVRPPDLDADGSALPVRTEGRPQGPATLGDYFKQSLTPEAAANQFDRFKGAVNKWGELGPHQVVEGIKDIGRGNFSRGAHEMIIGGGITAAPMLVPSLVRAFSAAPAVTTAQVIGGGAGGAAGQQVVQRTATALGASDDQAALAGDAGAIVGGGLAAKKLAQVPGAVANWRATRRTKQGAESAFTFRQAVPPTAGVPYTPEQFERASPYLDVEHATKPIQSVESLRDAADSAVSTIEAHIASAVEAHPNDLIRINPLERVRDMLLRSVRSGDVARGLRELDDLGLNQPLSVQQAERIRVRLNAENKAQLKKNNYDTATALKADPAFAARDAAAKALRDGIYQQLEARGVNGVRELRQDEGALIAIRNATERQMFNAEKRVSGTGTQGPTRRAIADVTRVVPKVGPYIADAIATPNQTRDQLVQKAFEMRIPASPPSLPAIPPDPSIRGLLTESARASGPAPDQSYVRSVPAVVQPSGQRALPPPARAAGPAPDRSGVRGVGAGWTMQRNPQTGVWEKVYLGGRKP